MATADDRVRKHYYLLRNEMCRLSGTGSTYRSVKVKSRFLPFGNTIQDYRAAHKMRNRLTREGKSVMRGMYRTNEHWGLDISFSAPDYHGYRGHGLKMTINGSVLRSIYRILGKDSTLRFSVNDIRVVPSAFPRIRPPRFRPNLIPQPRFRRRRHRFHPFNAANNLLNMMNPGMNNAGPGGQPAPPPPLMFPPLDSPGYTMQSGLLKIRKVQGTTPDAPERYICEDGMIPFPQEFFEHWDSGYEVRGTFMLELNVPERKTTPEESANPDQPELGTYTHSLLSSMLSDPTFADVMVIASNGTSIPCHKCTLASQSQVMKTMFATPLKEGTSDQLDMSEMGEASVRAFLNYLYTGDAAAARDNPEICIDLLMAGHRYMVRPLEEAMRKLLEEEPVSWLNANASVRLFLFGRLLDNGENLVIKAVEALKLNANGLKTSEDYRLLFESDPQSAMELSQFALMG